MASPLERRVLRKRRSYVKNRMSSQTICANTFDQKVFRGQSRGGPCVRLKRTDVNLIEGSNYYRIKVFDAVGEITYSYIVAVGEYDILATL